MRPGNNRQQVRLVDDGQHVRRAPHGMCCPRHVMRAVGSSRGQHVCHVELDGRQAKDGIECGLGATCSKWDRPVGRVGRVLVSRKLASREMGCLCVGNIAGIILVGRMLIRHMLAHREMVSRRKQSVRKSYAWSSWLSRLPARPLATLHALHLE